VKSFLKSVWQKLSKARQRSNGGRVVFDIFGKLFANAERMNDIIKNLINIKLLTN